MIDRLILPVPSIGNNHNVLGLYFESVGASLEALGYRISIIRIDGPQALAALFRELDKGPSLLYSMFFSELRISAYNHFYNTTLDGIYPVSMFLLCGDMPYKRFMLERLRFSSPDTVVITAAKSYQNAVSLINPKLTRFAAMDRFAFMGAAPLHVPDWKSRDIDILIPMSLTRTTLRIADVVGRVGLESRKLALAYYEELIAGRPEPFALFLSLYRDHFGVDLVESAAGDVEQLMNIFRFMSDIDDIVRMERRLTMVRDLLVDVGPYRNVVALGPNADLGPAAERVRWVGYLPADEMREAMQRSKFVFHCHHLVPDSPHERVAETLVRGAVLVTDPNELLRQTLAAGTHYLSADAGRSLASLLNDDGCDPERMAQAGREVALARLTPAHHAVHLDRIFRQFHRTSPPSAAL